MRSGLGKAIHEATRSGTIRVVFALSFCLFCVPCHAAQQPLRGDWAGGFMFDNSWVTLNARFKNEGDRVGGEADYVIPSRESGAGVPRSEERRVGKEGRFRW